MKIFKISEILKNRINSHRNNSIHTHRNNVVKIQEFDARIKECKEIAFELHKVKLINDENFHVLNIL